ncbi:hypothetical protein [Methylibium sp. T29-B]|nr:hypothetical protein [Methylibium sp. T29-B]
MDTGDQSFNNRDELTRARVAGCFSCLGIFRPADIVLWLHEDSTAACPICGADTVLPHVDSLAALRAIHAGLVSTEETIPAVLDMTPPAGRGPGGA